MARRYKRKSYKKKSYKRKSYKRRRTVAPKVIRAVRRMFETKKNQDTTFSYVYNDITDTACHRLLPLISQGTGQSNRIGNRIAPVRLTIKIALSAANLNAVYTNASPTYFDIYIFKQRYANEYAGSPLPSDIAQFLQIDNGSGPYTGLITDGLRNVNQDIFTLKYRRRVLLSNVNQATGQNAFMASVNPNRTISINLTKAVKKMWSFDDADTLVTNDNLWIAVGATQTDGTDLGSSFAGQYSFVTDLWYKDA